MLSYVHNIQTRSKVFVWNKLEIWSADVDWATTSDFHQVIAWSGPIRHFRGTYVSMHTPCVCTDPHLQTWFRSHDWFWCFCWSCISFVYPDADFWMWCSRLATLPSCPACHAGTVPQESGQFWFLQQKAGFYCWKKCPSWGCWVGVQGGISQMNQIISATSEQSD